MRIPTTDLPSIIGNELNLPRKSVSATIKLLDDGATVPFIARYRKEATGELDEKMVYLISRRLDALRDYLKRREFVVEQIKAAGALTPELADRIEHTLDAATLEDIYLPFKPKRRTRAEMARERGLEPLAKIIAAQTATGVDRTAKKYVGEEVLTAEDAIAGALDIIAEWMSENEKARNLVRSKFQRSAQFTTTKVKDADDSKELYATFYDYTQPLRLVPSHRYLAARRGEEAGILKVSISINDDEMTDRLGRFFIKPEATDECAKLMAVAVKDAYKRLIRPSIENEIAASAKEKADGAAIDNFSDNLRQLLMAPPMFGMRVMGIDPGFNSGCKVVCLDEQGKLLADDKFNLNDPHSATFMISNMVQDFRIDVIALGSGTAGRETRRFLDELRFPRRVQIAMVNEDGASVYSASDIAREEFPDKDVTVRGAISIGRRLLDPLAELVKIDPKSIGVGQYQHDVDQNRLKDALDYTVESCVNSVGVNVNTASAPLLSYVSGIGAALARYIVDYRKENGPFRNREALMNVPRMGEKAFQQCAGFLRIPDGNNPLDNTAIHPERYALVEQMAKDLRTTTAALVNNPALASNIVTAEYVDKEVGVPTLTLIIDELSKPKRTATEAVENPVYDEAIRSIRDIRPGQEVSGKVNNITAFGAFVDLGIKENGLLHVSQMSERFINSPHEVVSIGQTIRAKVMDVDPERGRIALTLKGMDI
ncbi:MAG: RNA-binding transcriptional accessory protein [Bacteroides sp.]|nr:RNA-binding transcriptional accessory protein [Bacteroides sp.]MCM1379266.1 RNA-binding transcriptional accessory protein [Bacteroides sp.]MCM1445076.1 RNA-binding transcriptional accessory protein [Prevotella sp.]